jgi:outer membrane protein insertion porin family
MIPQQDRSGRFGFVAGMLRLAVTLVMLAGIGAMTATPTQAQNYSFSQVVIEGNQRVDAATIISYAGIARGQSVTAAGLNDAYQRIAGTGLFEVVDLVPSGSTLIIRVKEYPTINIISFEGNKRLKDEVLAGIGAWNLATRRSKDS